LVRRSPRYDEVPCDGSGEQVETQRETEIHPSRNQKSALGFVCHVRKVVKEFFESFRFASFQCEQVKAIRTAGFHPALGRRQAALSKAKGWRRYGTGQPTYRQAAPPCPSRRDFSG
jgi:hypothetical protein